MFEIKLFSIFYLSLFVHIVALDLLLNISTAFSNIKSVISCGSSIDIHLSFDPNQVSICPYVSIDKKQIQLIYMNSSFDQTTNQIIIYSKPSLKSSPRFLTKLSNNSFISPNNLNSQSTIYLQFSSELICRLSFRSNETICFYFSQSIGFVHIESQYDDIQRGSLILPYKTKIRFYTIFSLIAVIVFLICSFSIALICTKEISLRQTSKLDWIIDTRMAREEAAKRSAETGQDGGGGGHQHHLLLADELANRNSLVNPIDG